MKSLLHNIVQENLNGINASLISLLYGLNNNNENQQTFDIPETQAVQFRQWLESQSLEKLGESLTVRCLSLVRHFPALCGFDFLYRNFLSYCSKSDLYLNPHNPASEHIFAALLETIALHLRYPANEEEFSEDINSIELTVKDKIQKMKDTKTTLPEKYAEYLRLYDEYEPQNFENAHQLLFEIMLSENELRRFIFSNTDIPLSYMLYFIALDEFGHFSPVVRQAALYGLRNAHEDFLYKKVFELRNSFFTAFPVYIPLMPDITVPEFAHSIRKALCFFNAEYEYNTLYEISRAIFETMPDCRKFLYQYPLAISNAPGVALLSRQWASLAYRSFHDIKSRSVKRFIDVLDYTLPNSLGIPAVLFTDKELVLPFIRREYLCFTGIDNEAELRLRSVQDTYTPPKFVRTHNPNKAKDQVSTFMDFLELYAQGDNTIVSPQGHSITRDDIAMMIERHFILSEITPKNLIHAKIMLWYVEPIQSIFKISEATEETLSKINEYIESIYGTPLTIEAAKEKALEYIAQENEHIAELNRELDFDTENQWKPLQEGGSQWNKLYSILLRQYTRQNTLTLWELKGILYDIQKPRPKPFYYPVTAAIGKLIQKAISNFLKSYEKEHPNFIKARKWLYDYFYKKLDQAEKTLDPCGWKEYSGECLRRDRNCCTIPLPSPCPTPTGCNSNALACKLWLCSAARSRLVTTRQGRWFLSKRRLYSYLCQMFNIPLKIRCSKLNSFDDKAKEPFVDVSMPDWFDKPL